MHVGELGGVGVHLVVGRVAGERTLSASCVWGYIEPMRIPKSRFLSAFFAVLITGAGATAAHAEDFYIYNVPNDGTYVNASFGTWKAARGAYGEAALISTGPGTAKPDGGMTTQVIEFSLTAYNYFQDPTQAGHLAVFVRGDIYTPNPWEPNYPYRGHGITLGDVSHYQPHYHPLVGGMCTPATGRSTVAIEVAGSNSTYHGNCVFGDSTSAPTALTNNTTYKIRLTSTYSAQGLNTTTYYLWGQNGSLIHIAQRSYTYDVQTVMQGGVPRPLGGWFIAELGRGIQSSWSVSIRNLVSSWYGDPPEVP